MPRTRSIASSLAPLVLAALSLSVSGCCGCGDAIVEILLAPSAASSSSSTVSVPEPPPVDRGLADDGERPRTPKTPPRVNDVLPSFGGDEPDIAADPGSLVPAPLSAPEGVELTTDVALYDVDGDTAEALRRDINSKRPTSTDGTYDAHTDWHVSWTFQRVPRSRGCGIEQLNVKLSVRYQLPRWQPERRAPAPLVKRWSRYMTALSSHERNHALHGLRAAEDIYRKLTNLDREPTCDAAEAIANREGHAIIDAYARKDPEYDRSTTHGKTEGAVFP